MSCIRAKLVIMLLPLCFILSSLLADASHAENNNLRIAIVNMQKIEEKTKISKDMKEKMLKKEQELQQDLLKRKNKLENDFKTLESKRSILSSEELQKKAQKLELDFQKLQMDEKIYGQLLEATRMLVVAEIQDCIKKAANKIANDKYDVVIPIGLAIFMNEEKFDNITDKITTKMDDISKTVDVEKAYKQAKEQMDVILQAQHQRK